MHSEVEMATNDFTANQNFSDFGNQHPTYVRIFPQMPTAQSRVSSISINEIRDAVCRALLSQFTTPGSLAQVILALQTSLGTALTNQTSIESKIDTLDSVADDCKDALLGDQEVGNNQLTLKRIDGSTLQVFDLKDNEDQATSQNAYKRERV